MRWTLTVSHSIEFICHALQLTLDQAKTILSLADVDIEGVTGPSILAALSTWMCKPGYASLPLPYARAGNQLLVRFLT
jgi:hypothetical protein